MPAPSGCSKHFEGEDFLKTLSCAAGGFWGAWAVCGSCGRFGGVVGFLWRLLGVAKGADGRDGSSAALFLLAAKAAVRHPEVE